MPIACYRCKEPMTPQGGCGCADGICLVHGDCLDVLPELEAGSVSLVLTDPPYGLEFMGKEWDRLWTKRDKHIADLTGKSSSPFVAAAIERYVGGAQAQSWFTVILPVCKPGTMLASFGGTRTFHRLTCGIEDAGWEIRDCLMWLYGQGFPKSHDISKAIDKEAGAEREVVGVSANDRPGSQVKSGKGFDRALDEGQAHETLAVTAPATDAAKLWSGWGTALKPAWEPIVLAMKPLDGTFAANALEHGVAGLAIDKGRIPGMAEPTRFDPAKHNHDGWRMNATGEECAANASPQGRWPANVILDEEAGAMLDEQSGERPSTLSRFGSGGPNPSDVVKPGMFGVGGGGQVFGASGGASRFFYCPKASGKDRGNLPAEELPLFGESVPEFRNTHPTVKPLELMRYLLTLLYPPGAQAICLDPFTGSGTTLVAAKQMGRRAIGIELSEEYCRLAARRLEQEMLFT